MARRICSVRISSFSLLVHRQVLSWRVLSLHSLRSISLVLMRSSTRYSYHRCSEVSSASYSLYLSVSTSLRRCMVSTHSQRLQLQQRCLCRVRRVARRLRSSLRQVLLVVSTTLLSLRLVRGYLPYQHRCGAGVRRWLQSLSLPSV